MQLGDIYIRTLGTWVPEAVDTAEAVRAGLYDEADARETGQLAVVVAGADVAPADMAVFATRQAAERAGGQLPPMDLVIHATSSLQGPDWWPVASYVQAKTVGGTAPAWELRLGCCGGFAAIEVAGAFLRGDPARRHALITAGDNWSSDRVDRYRSAPGTPLADAASALVLSKEPGFARILAANSSGVPELEGMHRGAQSLTPAGTTGRERMDIGRRAVEFRDSGPALSNAQLLAAKTQAETIERSLEQAGITKDDIARVIYLNCGRYMIQQWLLDPLGMPIEKSTWEFGRRIGHSGPSDQFISLDHLLSTGEIGPGDHVLMVGLSPGMSFSNAVVEILDRPSWLDR